MKLPTNRLFMWILVGVMLFNFASPVLADQPDEVQTDVSNSEAEVDDEQDNQTRGSYFEVGVLTIVARQGHAFLVLENTSTMDYDIGPYTVDPGETITIGTFPKLDPLRPRSGIYFNLEAYGVYEEPYVYYGRYSMSTGLEYADILSIDAYISTPSNNTWMEGRECYVFAVSVWNLVADYTLPPDGTLLMVLIDNDYSVRNCYLPARPKSDAYYIDSYGCLVSVP